MAQRQEGLNWVLGGARAEASGCSTWSLTLTLRAGSFSMGHPKHEYLGSSLLILQGRRMGSLLGLSPELLHMFL